MNSILVLHIDQKYQSDNLYSNYHPSEQIRKVYQNINKLVSKYHLHINSIYVLKALVNVISERKLNVTLKYSCQYIDDTGTTCRREISEDEALQNLSPMYNI